MKIKIPNVGCPHCPPGAQAEGPFYLSRSFWFLCRAHRTKWLAGFDDDIVVDETEQRRRFGELGVSDFEYVCKEQVEQFVRALQEQAASSIMPVFVFIRRRDIERETGLILAGTLIVDIPSSRKKLKRREQQMIVEIGQRLIEMAQSGQMPDNAIAYSWPGGCKPANAVDVHNDALMEAWAKDRIVGEVRIDPRDDIATYCGKMGLVKPH
jgi:hypothetical protein